VDIESTEAGSGIEGGIGIQISRTVGAMAVQGKEISRIEEL
jgi:hypothetical protein